MINSNNFSFHLVIQVFDKNIVFKIKNHYNCQCISDYSKPDAVKLIVADKHFLQ